MAVAISTSGVGISSRKVIITMANHLSTPISSRQTSTLTQTYDGPTTTRASALGSTRRQTRIMAGSYIVVATLNTNPRPRTEKGGRTVIRESMRRGEHAVHVGEERRSSPPPSPSFSPKREQFIVVVVVIIAQALVLAMA
ncbi:Uu.00g131860.m01.CDS01 [Anthostomella pinea]|uniref:Uu.00g131860.m01.CDS01 n=1 Tax=Anthostomella pinea TaxID=933095 RepID=A0AAI8YIF6_9PEZI|nr:Uu.00g131860.m01.CDS01 [Anthostomella pinea]